MKKTAIKVSIWDCMCCFCNGPIADEQRLLCGHGCCKECAKQERDLWMAQRLVHKVPKERVLEECEHFELICDVCGKKTPFKELKAGSGVSERRLEAIRRKAKKQQCTVNGCLREAAWSCDTCKRGHGLFLFCEAHGVEHCGKTNHPGGQLDGKVQFADLMKFFFAKMFCSQHDKPYTMRCITHDDMMCEDCKEDVRHRWCAVERMGLPEEARKRVERVEEDTDLLFQDVDLGFGGNVILHESSEEAGNNEEEVKAIRAKYAKLYEELKAKEEAEIRAARAKEGPSAPTLTGDSIMRAVAARGMHMKNKLVRMQLMNAPNDKIARFVDRMERCNMEAMLIVEYVESKSCMRSSVRKSAKPSDTLPFISIDTPVHTRAVQMTTPTLRKQLLHCGAVFSPVTRMIYETSWHMAFGMSIVRTPVDKKPGSKPELLPRVVPFHQSTGGVSDGAEKIYFADSEGESKFGFFDVVKQMFTMLESPPEPFAESVNSVFVGGCVYCVSEKGASMKYDPASNTWDLRRVDAPFEETSTSEHMFWTPDRPEMRFVAHPWEEHQVIRLDKEGCVRVFDVDSGELVKKYASHYPGAFQHPNLLAVRASEKQFFLMMCSGTSQPWRVFNSKKDKWENTHWMPTSCRTCSTVLDEKTFVMYYHIDGSVNWNSVKLAQA